MNSNKRDSGGPDGVKVHEHEMHPQKPTAAGTRVSSQFGTPTNPKDDGGTGVYKK